MRTCVVLLTLVVPGLVLADDKPASKSKYPTPPAAADVRLAELEAQLQAVLAEIKALRAQGGTAKSDLFLKDIVIDPARPNQDVLLKLADGKVVDVELALESKHKPAVATVETDWLLELRWADEKRPAEPAKPAQNTPATTQRQWAYYPAGQGDANTVHLTRVTYTMPADKIKALEGFLKDHVKVKVLETKAEGDKLTVTTTPDVQETIGQVVGLITGKPRAFYYGVPAASSTWKPLALPATPATPKAVVPAPSPPAIPKPPATPALSKPAPDLKVKEIPDSRAAAMKRLQEAMEKLKAEMEKLKAEEKKSADPTPKPTETKRPIKSVIELKIDDLKPKVESLKVPSEPEIRKELLRYREALERFKALDPAKLDAEMLKKIAEEYKKLDPNKLELEAYLKLLDRAQKPKTSDNPK